MATAAVEERKVSVALGIGILLLPVIFAWFTLRAGYSTLARGVSFGWMALALILVLGSAPDDPAASAKVSGDAETVASSEAPAPPATVDVTAEQLFDAYEANEARAQKTYGDKRLRVTGVVAGVDLGLTDKPSIQLVSPSEFAPVTMTNSDDISAKAADLDKGDAITAICSDVSEVLGRPFLDGCAIE